MLDWAEREDDEEEGKKRAFDITIKQRSTYWNKLNGTRLA